MTGRSGWVWSAVASAPAVVAVPAAIFGATVLPAWLFVLLPLATAAGMLGRFALHRTGGTDGAAASTDATVASIGVFLSIVALVEISFAVGAERQNYWQAFHFAAIWWCGLLGAAMAGPLSLRAWRGGRAQAFTLLWTDCCVLCVYVIIWLYTWFEPVQELEGWLARTAFLATHG